MTNLKSFTIHFYNFKATIFVLELSTYFSPRNSTIDSDRLRAWFSSSFHPGQCHEPSLSFSSQFISFHCNFLGFWVPQGKLFVKRGQCTLEHRKMCCGTPKLKPRCISTHYPLFKTALGTISIFYSCTMPKISLIFCIERSLMSLYGYVSGFHRTIMTITWREREHEEHNMVALNDTGTVSMNLNRKCTKKYHFSCA